MLMAKSMESGVGLTKRGIMSGMEPPRKSRPNRQYITTGPSRLLARDESILDCEGAERVFRQGVQGCCDASALVVQAFAPAAEERQGFIEVFEAVGRGSWSRMHTRSPRRRGGGTSDRESTDAEKHALTSTVVQKMSSNASGLKFGADAMNMKGIASVDTPSWRWWGWTSQTAAAMHSRDRSPRGRTATTSGDALSDLCLWEWTWLWKKAKCRSCQCGMWLWGITVSMKRGWSPRARAMVIQAARLLHRTGVELRVMLGVLVEQHGKVGDGRRGQKARGCLDRQGVCGEPWLRRKDVGDDKGVQGRIYGGLPDAPSTCWSLRVIAYTRGCRRWLFH